jgi:hypothetical protein
MDKAEESAQIRLLKEVRGYINFKISGMEVSSTADNPDFSFYGLELEHMDNLPIVGLDALHYLPDSLQHETGFQKIFGEYHSRNFISGVSEKYNLIEALGHLYEKGEDGKLYKVTFKKLITGNFEPELKKVDKIYFKSVLTDSTEVKAGIKFLSLEASKSSKVELLIKDEISVSLPDENRDIEALKKIKTVLGPKANNLYYSYGATLSSITNKNYKKSKWRPGIDASWFTFSRGKFLGQENFSYRNDVHVDLIALSKLIN